MITDQNFRFIENDSGINSGITNMEFKDGIGNYCGRDKEDVVEFHYDTHLVSYPNDIFKFYGIKFDNTVLAKATKDKEIAVSLKEQFPNEVILFSLTLTYIIWYSDMCSDELLTTITLLGL